MIQINLLDGTQVKRKRRMPGAAQGSALPTGSGRVMVLAAIVLMVGLNGWLGVTSWRGVHAARVEFQAVEQRQKKLEREIAAQTDEAERVRIFRDVVENQMEILRSLDPPDLILWSQKVYILANLVPAGVFIEEVKVNEQVEMVETDQSQQAREKWKASAEQNKGPEPKAVMIPIIRYQLFLTGLAVGQDNIEQFNNVMAFHRAMTEHQEATAAGELKFMDGFEPEIQFDSVEATLHEGNPVNRFIFKLTTLPMGGEKTPEKNAPASSGAARRVASASKS